MCGLLGTSFFISIALLPLLAFVVQVGPEALALYRQRGIHGLLELGSDRGKRALQMFTSENVEAMATTVATSLEAAADVMRKEMGSVRREGLPALASKAATLMHWARVQFDTYLLLAATAVAQHLRLPWTVCQSDLELTERTFDDSWRQTYVMDRRVFATKTPFQQLEIFESRRLGRVMALDGVLQFSERFESNYHELMAHVPVNILLGPDGVVKDGRDMQRPEQRVLILGGGDGGVATRVLKHEEVSSVTLCEIDKVVIDSARTWFSSQLNGAFSDPRLTIQVGDATKWVKQESAKIVSGVGRPFDLIVIDTTDWSLGGEWSLDFYVTLSAMMGPSSLVVTNLDTPLLTASAVTPAVGGLKTVFDHVHLFMVRQPEFVTGSYCFMAASKGLDAREARVTWRDWEAKAIETNYYNEDVHEGAFALPAYLQRAVDQVSDF